MGLFQSKSDPSFRIIPSPDRIIVETKAERFMVSVSDGTNPYTGYLTYRKGVVHNVENLIEYLEGCYQGKDTVEDVFVAKLVRANLEKQLSSLIQKTTRFIIDLTRCDHGFLFYYTHIDRAGEEISGEQVNVRWYDGLLEIFTSIANKNTPSGDSVDHLSSGGVEELSVDSEYALRYRVTGPNETFEVNCDSMFVDENRELRFMGRNPRIIVANCSPNGYYSCRLIARRPEKNDSPEISR